METKKGGWCCNCMNPDCEDRFCKCLEPCSYPAGLGSLECVLKFCEDFIEFDPGELV